MPTVVFTFTRNACLVVSNIHLFTYVKHRLLWRLEIVTLTVPVFVLLDQHFWITELSNDLNLSQRS